MQRLRKSVQGRYDVLGNLHNYQRRSEELRAVRKCLPGRRNVPERSVRLPSTELRLRWCLHESSIRSKSLRQLQQRLRRFGDLLQRHMHGHSRWGAI